MTDVYVDASSAILLYRARLFETTARAFSLVLAREVFREVTREAYPGSELFREFSRTGQIRAISREPDTSALAKMQGWATMDRGEQETIALAADQGEGAFVLMDDGQGARFCARHRIPFINALLVPKIFWYSKLMDDTTARKKMETLSELGRYSPQIIEKAHGLTRKDLAFFIKEEAGP